MSFIAVVICRYQTKTVFFLYYIFYIIKCIDKIERFILKRKKFYDYSLFY